MRYFLLLLAFLMESCVSAPAVSPSFTTFDLNQFIVNQPGNFISVRFPGATNIYYIPGTFGYYSNQSLYLGTNNFAGGGGGSGTGVTNLLATNAVLPSVSGSIGFIPTNYDAFNSAKNSTNAGNIAFVDKANSFSAQQRVTQLIVGNSAQIVLNGNGSGSVANAAMSWDASGNLSALSFTGNGASVTALNASALATGTVPTARLGSGTANALTFLRGDNSWFGVVTNVLYTNSGPDTLVIGDTSYLNTNSLGGGGGGSGITALTGDVTASGSGSVAATVKGINGTILGSLLSGVLLNTFSTGVPTTVADWPSLSSKLTGLVPTSALGSGSASGTTFLAGDQTYKTISGSAPNFLFQTLTPVAIGASGVTNVIIDMQALINYTNAANLTFYISATTNLYINKITNGIAGQSFFLDIQQAGTLHTNLVSYDTNGTLTAAATVPTAFGQFIVLPTNSIGCHLMDQFYIGLGGTNAFLISQIPVIQ